MRLKTLIVDDEPPARARLASLLAEIDDVQVVGEGATGQEALELTMDLSPDVVLLDVRMPDMDGLEAARRIATMSEPPAVIFTTAYDEYALPAFEAQAAGYLVKPIRKDKLAAALAACGRLTRPQLARAESAAAAPAPHRSHIPVRRRDGIRLIPLGEIRCFVADQKYTTVRHEGGDDLIEDSLRLLEDEFAESFVRIHRSALVSVQHLERIERDPDGQYFVRLRDMPDRLAVSRRMAGDLRDRFRL
ncbi:MAG: Sensory transduction protein LytR [Steroidobacteraceae bacterium]|nr:Sensory transduction protein LytR [Steroidobacteraceae bacterium]